MVSGQSRCDTGDVCDVLSLPETVLAAADLYSPN